MILPNIATNNKPSAKLLPMRQIPGYYPDKILPISSLEHLADCAEAFAKAKCKEQGLPVLYYAAIREGNRAWSTGVNFSAIIELCAAVARWRKADNKAARLISAFIVRNEYEKAQRARDLMTRYSARILAALVGLSDMLAENNQECSPTFPHEGAAPQC